MLSRKMDLHYSRLMPRASYIALFNIAMTILAWCLCVSPHACAIWLMDNQSIRRWYLLVTCRSHWRAGTHSKADCPLTDCLRTCLGKAFSR